MKNKGTQNEEIRCINKKTGKVKYFRRWFAHDKNWQKSTGFVPEELPKVSVTLNQKVVNPLEGEPAYDYEGVITTSGLLPDLGETDLIHDFITSESDEPESITEQETKETQTTPTAKPKGKKADKTTHK